MNLEQTTDRLILRILSADDAEKVLQFYKDNAAIFEQFEPLVGNDFYSLEHQKNPFDLRVSGDPEVTYATFLDL